MSGTRLMLQHTPLEVCGLAFLLAETYDSRVLSLWNPHAIPGDCEKARALHACWNHTGASADRDNEIGAANIGEGAICGPD
jgi:hypothetical protein